MKWISPDWPAPENICAYTTLRDGWSSQNTPLAEERAQLSQLLTLPSDPVWLDEIHSVIALEALPQNRNQTGDASYSRQPNHICIVLTADCLPILICTQQGTQVAAIHAGWRGLANGVIENTVQALHQPPQELMVWLGPAIGPNHFEVGKDVYEAFTSRHTTSTAAFKPHQAGKWFADLYALAKIRLELLGITHIYGGEFCTYSQPSLFHSYRRDKAQAGRMASVIWIDR